MKKLFLNRATKLGKRKRLGIAAFFITAYIFLITFLEYSTALVHIPILALFVYVATYFGILEDIEGIEWVQLFILPIVFSISALLFYYLLPVRLLTRIPFSIVVFIALYAVFLSENIFNVGIEKSLPLYRAAYSVANLIILVVLLLVFTTLYSLSFNLYANAIIGGALAFPIIFHGLWIANPMSVLEERVVKYSAVVSTLLVFGILSASFLPLRTNLYAVFTVAMAYFLLGVTQEILQDTVFMIRIRQYIIMYLVLLIFILLSIQL